MITFATATLPFIIWSLGILLHPLISIPVGIAIDFIISCFEKCFNIDCKKKCVLVFSMPLYFALVCLCQYYLISKWDTFKRDQLDVKSLAVRGSFDLFLDFNQCCAESTCVLSGKPDINIGKIITDFFNWKSKDGTDSLTSLQYVLITVAVVMILYFMIEYCIGKATPMYRFILGPSRNKRENSIKLLNLKIQLFCCILTVLALLAIFLSPKLFEKALVSKLIACENGKYDSNPDVPVPRCVGKPIESFRDLWMV